MSSSNDGGYQDVNALLRSLTAYLPGHQPASDGLATIVPVKEHEAQEYNAQGLPIDAQLYQAQLYQAQLYQAQLYQAQLNTPAQYRQSLHGPIAPDGYHAVQYQAQLAQPQAQPELEKPSSTRPRSVTPAGQNVIDPKTITEWPAALRYTTKLTATHEGVAAQLRRMIANQHNHERNWWAGREALQKQQTERINGKKTLDDVFRSVGVEASKDLTQEDDAAELKRYDVKVHKAQAKMVNTMTEELKGLGIPFFGTRDTLLVEAKEVSEKGEAPAGTGLSKQISPAELAKLQKRMLAFLEELCSD